MAEAHRSAQPLGLAESCRPAGNGWIVGIDRSAGIPLAWRSSSTTFLALGRRQNPASPDNALNAPFSKIRVATEAKGCRMRGEPVRLVAMRRHSLVE